jgi:hypothetical protein
MTAGAEDAAEPRRTVSAVRRGSGSSAVAGYFR